MNVKSVFLCLVLVFSASFAWGTNVFTSLPVQSADQLLAESSHINNSNRSLYSALSVNTSALNKLSENDVVTFNMAGSDTQGTISNIFYGASGAKHIVVRSVINGITVSSIITLGDKDVFLDVATKTGVFTGLGDKNAVLMHKPLDLISSGQVDIDDAVVPLSTQRSDVMGSNKRESDEILSEQSDVDNADIAVIDIFFVYSSNVHDVVYNISTRIDHFIAYSNQVFEDSDIYVQLRFKGMLEVEYPYTNGSIALNDIANGRSPFEDVERYKIESGADAVALLTPQKEYDGSAGIAYQNGHLSSSASPLMYSQSDVDAGGGTFVHEIGHNLGLGHSRPQRSTGSDFPYGTGFRIPTSSNEGFNTIMAYSTQGAFGEVPMFSNPAKRCGEFPCGISKHDELYGADATSAVNAVRHVVASYGKAEGQAITIEEALVNVKDANLAQCLRSEIRDRIQYAHQVTNLSCYQNVSDLDGLEQFIGLTRVYLSRLDAVDLSAISALKKLTKLSLFDTPASDFSVLGDLSELQYLSLRAGTFDNSDAAVISSLTNLQTLILKSDVLTLLPNLSELPFLSEIDINAPIESVSFVQQNQRLTELKLRSSSLVLPSRLNWPLLEELEIVNGRVDTLAPFTSLTSLSELTLSRTGLMNVSGISKLPQLKSLDISNNNVTDVSELVNLSQLETLNVSENPISNISLLQALTELKSFTAGSYSDEQSWSFVNAFSRLKKLNLSWVDSESMDAIASLHNTIESLYLQRIQVKDLSELFNFYKLTSLQLQAESGTSFYCWQEDYLERLPEYSGWVYSVCDPSDDESDYDQDGWNNRSEINAGINPTENDNDTAKIDFLETNVLINEELGSVTYRGIVRRSGSSLNRSSVTLINDDVTASASDYFLRNTNLSFEKGENTKPFEIYIYDDFIIEGTETFTVTLSDVSEAELGEDHVLNVELNDNADGSDYIDNTSGDGLPFVGWESSYSSVNESEKAVRVTLNRPSNATGPFSVEVSPIALTDNTKNAFTVDRTKIEFAEGENVKTVIVRFADDNVFNGSKYVGLWLRNPVDINIDQSRSLHTLEIYDDEDEDRKIQFLKSSFNVNEADGYIDIRIVRNGNDTETRRLSIYQSSGNAILGKDATLSSTALTFYPSDTEKRVRLFINDDNFYEGFESLQLGIDGIPFQLKGTNWSTYISISDNDMRGSESGKVSFEVTSSETLEGAGRHYIKVVRTGDLSDTLRVIVEAEPGSATSADYSGMPSFLDFEPGESEKEVDVYIVNDGIEEGDESFTLTLNADPEHLGDVISHSVTITENTQEVLGEISVLQRDVIVRENMSAEIVLLRSGNSDNAQSVNLSFSEGTALKSDFIEHLDDITFAPGETKKVVPIQIVDDALDENIESFYIYVRSDISNTVVTPSSVSVYIIDNDSASSIPFDYDGDGMSDIVIRRPDIGQFLVARSSDNKIMRAYFGASSSDIPLAGDFDGDGTTDIAIRRPPAKQFISKTSSNNQINRLFFGSQDNDIPVIADYDGDGKADIAIRRPATGQWFIKYSSTGQIVREIFGLDASDTPAVADYDGDGKADIAVRRKDAGQFIIKYSSTGEIMRVSFGSQYTDIAVPADYDGDGKADIAIRRPSNGFWYIKRSTDGVIERTFFGSQADDIPVVADYDGDGISDLAIRRPSTGNWIVKQSSNGEYSRLYFGSKSTDVPIAAPLPTVLNMTAAVSNNENDTELEAFGSFEFVDDISLIKETLTVPDIWATEHVINVD